MAADMEFTFLGTSSGVPTRRRNVSGLALRGPKTKSWFLVDCGEGTQQQLLKTSYSLNSLSAIFITHVHGDHCLGLPGLLASAGMARRAEPLTIVGPEPLRQFIDTALRVTQSYLPYEWCFVPVETLQSWEGSGVAVEKWELSHRVPSYAYSFTESEVERKLDTAKLEAAGIPSGPAWGKLLRGEPLYSEDGTTLGGNGYLLPPRKARRIVVGGDNDRPELLTTACETADLLIHESTYTEAVSERVGAGRQHSHAASVAKFANNIGLKNLILTHFSARYQLGSSAPGLSMKDLENEARNYYSGNVDLAEDLAHYRLDKSGNLSRPI